MSHLNLPLFVVCNPKKKLLNAQQQYLLGTTTSKDLQLLNLDSQKQKDQKEPNKKLQALDRRLKATHTQKPLKT